MSYNVKKSLDIYNVIEKNTAQIIMTYEKEKEARETCRSLNLGGGFNGFTPSFFLCKFAFQTKRKTV